MKKKLRLVMQRRFRRVGALLSALVMSALLVVPCSASNNWPASPSAADFYNHPNSWYVWQSKDMAPFSGFELIAAPMLENGSTNTTSVSYSYSTSSYTYSFTGVTGNTFTYMMALPYIPIGYTSYWSNLPSFPVGMKVSGLNAVLRLYPDVSRGALADISDVFSDRTIYAFLTSSALSSSASWSDTYDNQVFNEYPVYVPSFSFPFGSKVAKSTGSVSGFGIVDGDNHFWATPANEYWVDLSSSHMSNRSMDDFPQNFSIPSSEIGLVFAKSPGSGTHYYNTEFNVSNLWFMPTLWVPSTLLPSDTAVGDWISKEDLEGMQDQLLNDFDVDSGTLKSSKATFDGARDASTIDATLTANFFTLFSGLLSIPVVPVVLLMCAGFAVISILLRKALS